MRIMYPFAVAVRIELGEREMVFACFPAAACCGSSSFHWARHFHFPEEQKQMLSSARRVELNIYFWQKKKTTSCQKAAAAAG